MLFVLFLVDTAFHCEAAHHCDASTHVDSHVFVFPGNFWDADIVKEINEVLVEPRQVQVHAKIGKGGQHVV